MALDSDDALTVLDPADFGGRKAARSQERTAEEAAEVMRQMFDASQENLRPFLELGNQQLAGLGQAATAGGFFDVANQLRPAVDAITGPVVDEKMRELTASLASRGMTRSGFAGQSAADIQQDIDISTLLQLQEMFSSRRKAIAGQGQGAGSQLSILGQQAGENIGSILSQGILGAQQTRAAGNQNLVGLADAGLGFVNRPQKED